MSQMKNSKETDTPIKRDYILDDKYYSLTIRHLATTGTRTMIALSLHVFLYDGIEDRHEEIDRYSRSLLYNFELVNIMNPHKKTTKQIYSNLDFPILLTDFISLMRVSDFSQIMSCSLLTSSAILTLCHLLTLISA